MRKLLVVAILTVPFTYLNAQKYQFEYREKEQEPIQGISYKKHFLGDEIAQKIQLVKEAYTYSLENEITRVSSTAVEKPSIYYSVNKVNKYIKKSLKNGSMTKEDAIQVLDNMLNVVINIRYQETEELEQELWSVKDPVTITSLYNEGIAMN